MLVAVIQRDPVMSCLRILSTVVDVQVRRRDQATVARSRESETVGLGSVEWIAAVGQTACGGVVGNSAHGGANLL